MNHLPNDFLQQLIEQKGETFANELAAVIEAQESVVSIRFQKNIAQVKNSCDLPTEMAVPWDSNAFYLSERPNFAHDPLWHAGAYYVQEASSMILACLIRNNIDVRSSMQVLDLCAAPGGKSTQVLSLMNDESFMLCNEIIPKRAQILKENLIKSGFSNIAVSSNEPKDFIVFQNSFDIVLVDAPCSGEGLFRKDADAISEWSQENVANCVYRQKNILSHAMPLVKENGLLVYSTCTYNRKENIEQVQFLLDTGLFEMANLELPADFGFESIQEDAAAGIQAYPSKVRGEGFFISVLRKKSHTYKEVFEQDYYFNSKFEAMGEELIKIIEPIYSKHDDDFYIAGNEVYAWKQSNTLLIKRLYNNLKVVYAATKIGELKKTIFIPAAEMLFNFSIAASKPERVINVDRENALRFLKKENINKEQLPIIANSDWFIVSYKGFALGWLKVMPGQKQNNYYPLEWRLRK